MQERPSSSVVRRGLLGLVCLCLATTLGCSRGEPPCADPAASLVDGLSCADVLESVDFVEYLAARPMPKGAHERLMETWASAAKTDVDRVRGALTRIDAFMDAREGEAFAEAERRGSEGWRVLHGEGVLAGEGLEDVREHVRKHIGVWKQDDDNRIVVSENDVEGWIRYASLGREAQGAIPLRVSMADKVGLYKAAMERFEQEDREGRLAFIAVGGGWTAARAAWMKASYETQQAWIAAAPLPPAMFGTSPEYFRAFLGVAGTRIHAEILNERLGPLLYDPR